MCSCSTETALLSPPIADVFPGISLQVIKELAGRLGIPFTHRKIDPDELAQANEVFLTSTPNCILPVTRFNGTSDRQWPAWKGIWLAPFCLERNGRIRRGRASAAICEISNYRAVEASAAWDAQICSAGSLRIRPVSPFCECRRIIAAKPNLAPVRINAARARAAVAAAANHIFQNDANAFGLDEAARRFFDHSFYAAQHAHAAAAVRKHFRIERQASVATAFVERGENFFLAFDDDPLAGVEVQFLGRRLFKRAGYTWDTPTQESQRQFIQHRHDEAANHFAHRHLIDEQISQVLDRLPPRERSAGVFEFGGLAAVADFSCARASF